MRSSFLRDSSSYSFSLNGQAPGAYIPLLTKLKVTEEPEILVKINTKYHDDLFNIISIC